MGQPKEAWVCRVPPSWHTAKDSSATSRARGFLEGSGEGVRENFRPTTWFLFSRGQEFGGVLGLSTGAQETNDRRPLPVCGRLWPQRLLPRQLTLRSRRLQGPPCSRAGFGESQRRWPSSLTAMTAHSLLAAVPPSAWSRPAGWVPQCGGAECS